MFEPPSHQFDLPEPSTCALQVLLSGAEVGSMADAVPTKHLGPLRLKKISICGNYDHNPS